MKATPVWCVAALLFAGPACADPAARLQELADRYYAFRLESQPEIAYFSGVALARHDGLTDNSPAGRARIEAAEDAMLTELESIDARALKGTTAWITHGILEQALTSARELRVCRYPLWAVSQMAGWQLDYAQLAELQPVGTPERREQALTRWRKLPGYIDQEIANLKAGLAAGWSSPRAAVRRVIGQLDGVLAIPVAESPFASPGRRDGDAGFLAAFVALVDEAILPAVQRYRDFLADTYLEAAREALAVTANPDGRACYEASLRSYTTLDRSPEAVFELGMRTVENNKARVIELGEAAYGLDDFTAIMERIRNDPANKFESAEELLEFSRETVEAAEKAVPRWFGHVPDRRAVVEPYPPYQDGTGVSARYEPGDADRPGVYRIPLFEPKQQGRGNAEATAFHEVWPGHHLQVAIAQEIEGLHPVTQITWYSGMGEGWARYSESLAAEMDLYRTTTGPIGRLAWPARGMVVDPGIHLFGWSREQAVAFMGQAGRMTERELDEMVDRIAVLPGQLTAYDSGGLEIFAVRELARERLGAGFDIRAFHDRVLENGTVPLTLLRTHVEDWIARSASQPAVDAP